MIGDILGIALVFGAGLVVGWFLLPAPARVQNFWHNMTGWFK